MLICIKTTHLRARCDALARALRVECGPCPVPTNGGRRKREKVMKIRSMRAAAAAVAIAALGQADSEPARRRFAADVVIAFAAPAALVMLTVAVLDAGASTALNASTLYIS